MPPFISVFHYVHQLVGVVVIGVVVRGVSFTWTGVHAQTLLQPLVVQPGLTVGTPNSRIRLRAVAGHSWSQCSSVSAALWKCGQVAAESASTMCRYSARLWQWPLRSWARRTESFLERETGARLPLKTALVLSWLMTVSIVSLFVKALAVWKVMPPSVAAGSSSEAAAAPALPSTHSFPMSPIWPGTHCSETRVFSEFRFRRVSARSDPSLNPGDCRSHGLTGYRWSAEYWHR